jgi:hypothetical protein
MAYKDELLQEMDQEYAALEAVVAGVEDSIIHEVFLGRWSAREIIAHIAGWQREMVPALERLARGERPTPEGVDYSNVHPWNDIFVDRYAPLSTDAMKAELAASFDAFKTAAHAVPEGRFEPGKTVDRMMHSTAIRHHREHRGQIEAWLSSRKQ